ncbi:MAG: small nucleolar ribonucleoprotein [Methanolobus sp.]|nr:small nucleolar ribonucleoprotein [Methanolobus sp.]
MLITSSRKPSASTRTLCKLLASFFDSEYINRGKMGMGEVLASSHGSPLLIVGEYHGNPGNISIYDPEGFCALSANVILVPSASPYPRSRGAVPVVAGESDLSQALSGMLLLENVKAPQGSRVLAVGEDRMDFIEGDNTLFILKVKSYRIYEGDSP